MEQGLIVTNVKLSYGGKTKVYPVVVDTGADAGLVLDKSVATDLGMPTSIEGMVAGVGGTQLSYSGTLDEISLSLIPECTYKSVKASLLDLKSTFGSVGLLGLDFITASGMKIESNGKTGDQAGVLISCKGGKPVEILKSSSDFHASAPGGKNLLLAAIGGLAVLGIVIYFSFIQD